MTGQISKGERDELRRIVRGDFKALTEEIDVRRAEMMAEIEKRVASRFKANEDLIATTEIEINEIIEEANGQILGKLRLLQDRCEGYTIHTERLHKPHMYFTRDKRDEMRRAMIADLDARVAQAKARMHRHEIDLLKDLSAGALESDAANSFLDRIPKVAELVSDERLRELEAQFDDDPRT